MNFSNSDWRMASLLLDQHGAEASGVAMQRALDARAAQNRSDEAMWLRVFDAVVELQSTALDQSSGQRN